MMDWKWLRAGLLGPLFVAFLLSCGRPALRGRAQTGDWFEDSFEHSDIVCIADAIRELPAAEPTPQMRRTTDRYLVLVRHVWKGDVGDTLLLRGGHGLSWGTPGGRGGWLSCGGPRDLRVGRRYLIFAMYGGEEIPGAFSRTDEIRFAAADIRRLLRTKGQGRQVGSVSIAGTFPSFRSLVRDVESGDSLAQEGAAWCLGEMEDSAGIGVPALGRALENARWDMLQRRICNALQSWAPSDKKARNALLAALESPNRTVRVAVVQANSYGAFDGFARAVERRMYDPDPEVRTEALARLLDERVRSERIDPRRMIGICVRAATDSSRLVRMLAVRGLVDATAEDSSRAIAALRKAVADPDTIVSFEAREALGKLRNPGRR